jgi:hypothetical protein
MAEEEHQPAIKRLKRDLVEAAITLTDQEARFLVDAYYLSQDGRKRANSQIAAMSAEPHSLIAYVAESNETIENQIKRALQRYSENHPVGRWMMSIFGIGPVISAGMLAHINIDQAPTVGHIWRFAGLDPTVKWEKKTKRPWNAALRTLSWKVGQSFMKFSGNEACTYGALYRKRKAFETARNESGQNAVTAAAILLEKNFKKNTEAYKSLSTGKLPPAQIDGRARRYAVKLFLSHMHSAWFFVKRGELPPEPYALAHQGHVHFIPLPNPEEIDGLREALRAKGWR